MWDTIVGGVSKDMTLSINIPLQNVGISSVTPKYAHHIFTAFSKRVE